MQLRCMPCIVVGHLFGNLLERHPSHTFLNPGAPVVSRVFQPGDVLPPRFRETLQRRLELQLDVIALLRDDIPLEVAELRIVLLDDARDAHPITLDLEIGEMPRLLHRRERAVHAADAEPVLGDGSDEVAELLGEGAEKFVHE